MSCGVGQRFRSDLALLWLWCRPADTAPIRPVVWESPYASGAALKRERKREREKERISMFKVKLKFRLLFSTLEMTLVVMVIFE